MRIKNWQKFQHYKDRRPPWIKLHRTLLDDREFYDLSPLSAKCLILLWLIASEEDGVIPEAARGAWRLHISETEMIEVYEELFSRGFLEEGESKTEREEWSSRYVPKVVREEVWARDHGTCQTPGCGVTTELEIDHVVPVSKGGKSVLENLQLLCRPCNRRKRSKLGLSAEHIATQMPSDLHQTAHVERSPETETEAYTQESEGESEIQRRPPENFVQQHPLNHARRMMEVLALPQTQANLRAVEAAVSAEAVFLGVDLNEAAQTIANKAMADRTRGVAIDKFYFEDTKWRNGNGSKISAAVARTQQTREALVTAVREHIAERDGLDGKQRENGVDRRPQQRLSAGARAVSG